VSDFDLIVIGGGAIGLASAWRLAQQGLTVAVLERDKPGSGATHVAAGMLAPVAEADPAEEPLLALMATSAKSYPEFVSELSEASGLDPGYFRCGALITARDRDEAEEIEHELAVRRRLGLNATHLRPTEARNLEPALAPTLRGALDLPDDNVIDPRRLTPALAEAVRRAGGQLFDATEAAALELVHGAVSGVRLTDGRLISAPRVLVAAGVWSPALVPGEAQVPVRPVKGQILRMHDPGGPGLVTRVLRIAGAYLVPRGDGRYVLGATVEERGFDTTVTAGALFELLRDASELVPGLSELVIDELIAGLRPGTPDNAPVIGPGAIDGLFWATGHYRHGILLTPITADLVSRAVAGEAVPEEFAPERFARVEAARR
jgi:glycine oxidase